ncbi:Zinc transporter ZupT [Candidatus Bilamarchaeum dharawalense]|uniref:Zinc transporter ZupT n=1 Tax=Candidatus Bilamarchaeum dharawalense TaxID=2885759 RepID=A0A5E4LTE0_9ARCH|nr:Zinc transporter ZupT [Candidatus Bilamarchaeum dharawalense]
MLTDLIGGAVLVTLATGLGALSTFYISDICKSKYTLLLAFSAGVMMFTSLEMISQAHHEIGHVLTAVGLLCGMLLIFLSEKLLPHIHQQIKKTELPTSKKKAALIVGTIAIHNIPEGFAIAAAFAGSVPLGWFTATSMAIQDAPEGALISAPLICYGLDKKRAVGFGILSGVVEGLAAVIGYLFLTVVLSLVPFALAFSAGAMMYVVLVEIMPDVLREKEKYVGSLVFIIGIVIAFLLAGLFS